MSSPLSSSFDRIGLPALEARLDSDLACLGYPPANWVKPRAGGSDRHCDVVIVGGGMCGLLAWLALRMAGIERVRILDSSEPGREGPWVSYARMQTLRSPKQLTGPAYGIAALTFQAWFRAQFGAADWESLDKIPRTQWMDYLRWYRQALSIPVENQLTLTRVSPDGEGVRLTLSGLHHGTSDDQEIFTRKLIYATGRDGIGYPTIPGFVAGLQRRCWAHSSEPIDFPALAGQRVAVVGVGASAVDNAAEALEAGALEVRHLIRRREMPTINKMMGIGSFGFTAGYAALPDEWRWRFMQYSFTTQTPAPRGSTLRVGRHDNAWFHFDKAIDAVSHHQGALRIRFHDDTWLDTDFLILGTGFTTDPLARRELGEAAGEVQLWEDVYTPPTQERNADLGRFPYLNADFTFRERQAGAAPWLKHLYCFNYGATASLGKVSGDIPGISDGARWLARSVAATLYGEDIEHHWQGMLDYARPELQGDEWSASPLPMEAPERDAV